ncbi:hypothetical protein [Rhodoflexus caldus]|uniref:hypothetical protein n=1 Tax=Rhodoflexus caldus TaxID=2891236 RepID=UPI00202AA210|nr:hypothetical protein [Rhodoflexus caldus]
MWRIYKACCNDWGLWLAFISGLACYWVASGGHLGLTLDSYYYLAAAENWAQHKQLIDHQGNIYANWPPLYPWLLALGAPQVLPFAAWLHGVALPASIYFFSRWLPVQTPPLIRNAALLSYALYAPLLASSIYLWSEIVFMALLTAAFAAFLRKEKPSILILYIILANLMCLQRNAGIFFIMAWAVAQFFIKGLRWRVIGAIALESGLAAVSFIAWQLRNFLWVTDAQDFRQNIALIDFAESFRLSLSAMSTWLLPLQVPELVRIAVFMTLFIAAMVVATKPPASRPIAAVLLLTFGCYLAGTWALRMNIPTENDRYFLPLFPFFLLLIIRALQAIKAKKLAAGLFVLLMSYHAARGVKNTLMWHQTKQKSAFGILHHQLGSHFRCAFGHGNLPDEFIVGFQRV